MKNFLRGFAAAALFLAGPAVSRGAPNPRNLYVDSGSGDDRNSGESPALAWASLERVNGADLKPGDIVRFRRGASWRGSLEPVSGEEGSPVTYSAYGEGEKPLLLGSESRGDPADWTEIREDIWATEKPVWIPRQTVQDLRRTEWRCHNEAGAKVSLDRREIEGGGVLEIQCRAPGSRSNHIQIWGPAVEWGKAGDAGHLLFRFRARCDKPFRTGGIGILRSGPPWATFASGGPAGPAIGTEWSDHEVALRILAKEDPARLHLNLGGLLPEGSVLELEPLELVAADASRRRLDVDVGNVIFDHGSRCGWKRRSIEELKNPYEYCYDPENQRVFVRLEKNPAEVHGSVELALRRHIVDQGGRHDVVYDGLALRYGAAHGFGGGGTARLVIRNCDLSYIGGGHQFTREDGKPVRFGNAIEFWGACRDHLVEGCRIWEVYDAALTNQGRGPDSVQENITYRNNLIWNCEYSFECWNNPETARTRNIRFVHNTCVNAGTVWSHAQRPDRNGSHLMFYSNFADTEGIVVKHNIFCRSTEWGSRYSAGWRPLPEIDCNIWHAPEGELCYFFRERIGKDDVQGYRQKTGLDRNSFFGDPALVDPSGGDFRLAPDSPARNFLPEGEAPGASP